MPIAVPRAGNSLYSIYCFKRHHREKTLLIDTDSDNSNTVQFVEESSLVTDQSFILHQGSVSRPASKPVDTSQGTVDLPDFL